MPARRSKKKRERKPAEEYDFLAIKVTEHRARVGAAINHEVRIPRPYNPDARVYQFDSVVEIEGVSTWPEERAGEKYSFTIYGSDRNSGEFEQTLEDYHAKDEDRSPKYRKLRGQLVPVYNVPKGLGPLERIRGTKDWTSWVFVAPRMVSDMLPLIASVGPLYLFVHERKIERKRWVIGLTLQTTDPAEE